MSCSCVYCPTFGRPEANQASRSLSWSHKKSKCGRRPRSAKPRPGRGTSLGTSVNEHKTREQYVECQVKRHRGTGTHTRAHTGHTDTRITQTNLTTIPTHKPRSRTRAASQVKTTLFSVHPFCSSVLRTPPRPSAAARQPCPNHATASGSAKRIVKGQSSDADTLPFEKRQASSHIRYLRVVCIRVKCVQCRMSINTVI